MSVPSLLKVQEGGGCWFHAPLNGWLLSERGREVISAMLAHYKSKHSINTSANLPHGAICPQRGHLPLNYFWRYVNLMLGNNRTKNPANFISNLIIKNTGLRPLPGVSANINLKDLFDGYNINNTTRSELLSFGVNSINKLTHRNLNKVTGPVNKLKRWLNLSPNNKLKEINMIKAKNRSKYTVLGGERDMHRFHRILFGANYSESENRVTENTVVFATTWPSGPLRLFIDHNNIRYTLSHSCIAMMPIDPTQTGHYVAGFISSKIGVGIYDSQFPVLQIGDWTKGPEVVQHSAMQLGLLVNRERSVMIYVRDGAANFVSEINSLGARRNDIAKYSRIRIILESKHDLTDYLFAKKEFNKLPNNSSVNYRDTKALVDRATAKTVSSYISYLNHISSNRNKLVGHRNSLSFGPLSRIPEMARALKKVRTLIRNIDARAAARNAEARRRAAARNVKRKR